MKRIGRRPFLFGSALLAACGGQLAPEESEFGNEPNGPRPVPGKPPPLDFPGVSDASTPSSSPSTCRDAAPNTPLPTLTGIGPRGPFPNIVYSWTTEAQAAGLRAGDPLFTKATTSTGHRGHIFSLLEQRAEAGDATAAALAGPAFELGRFAWPFAAGTRISPEDYGDRLLAIELRKEARIIAFSARLPGTYTVFDLAGNVVPNGDEELGRIGAFYFVNDTNFANTTFGPSCFQDTIRGSLVYRELYLGNIAMVAGYSLSTPAIHARLDAEAKDVRTLAAALDCRGEVFGSCESVAMAWAAPVRSTRIDRFFRSLAFATPFGGVGAGNGALAALADDLDGIDRTGAPHVVTF